MSNNRDIEEAVHARAVAYNIFNNLVPSSDTHYIDAAIYRLNAAEAYLRAVITQSRAREPKGQVKKEEAT